MERFTISKSEKQTIYEIYRACRLCGAGGGYRMPIIQNIVDLESSEVELRQKIQDCLQLEIRQDDRMPPLICELCVDKLNDFHEFLEMARQTNIRTRTRLGLPLPAAKKGESESGDCILGVTEPVFVGESSKKSKAGPKCSKKIKKEPETVNIKVETNTSSPSDSRSSSVSSRSSKARAASPPRPSRTHARAETPKPQVTPEPRPITKEAKGNESKSKETKGKEVKEKEIKGKEVKSKEVKGKEAKGKDVRARDAKEKETKEKEIREKEAWMMKHIISRKEVASLLHDNIHQDESSLLVPRSLKRVRDTESSKPASPPKRTRTTARESAKEPVKEPTPPPQPPPLPKPRPKSKQEPKIIPTPQKIPKPKTKVPTTPPKQQKEEETPPAKPPLKCIVCDTQVKTPQVLGNHMRNHVPTYTKLQNACNPCGKWFVTVEEANTHHRYHKAATFPYHCRRCFDDYRLLSDYDLHIERNECTPYEETPDVKCEECWKTFPTQNLMAAHRCPGPDGRPGGKCSTCSKYYVTHKNLKKHESTCYQKRKRDLIADPDVLRRLKPMQVRISRCDDLLTRRTGDHYDVSTVKPSYGLDRLYLYPYMSHKLVKCEPFLRNSMVAIHGPVKQEHERDSYIHWDSDDSDSDNLLKKVDSLSTIALKKIFSKSMIGKVPRKRRKVKNEVFDSTNDFNSVCSHLNDIIKSLNDDLLNSTADRNGNDNSVSVTNDKNVGNEEVDRNGTNLDMNNENDSETVLNETEISNDNHILSKDKTKGDVSLGRNDSDLSDKRIKTNNDEEMTDDVVTNNSKIDENDEKTEVNDENNVPVSENDAELNLIDTNNDKTVEEEVTDKDHSENHCNNVDVDIENEKEELNRIGGDENDFKMHGETNIAANVQELNTNENEATDSVLTNGNHEDDVNINNFEVKRSDEVVKSNKESPIKHSIENLIGDTDRNPEKYINEVISSIEDIIMKNPRKEDDGKERINGETRRVDSSEMDDQSLMDALDAEIEERDKQENDKITLEDLLPKEDRSMEMDAISEDDFNFDA